ncbi:MAG: glycosyltransferase family 4 protein [Patescibacteria group bacterium]|nr:glycosyltransferase family 4 protein [Patescibacteria group bacterium]
MRILLFTLEYPPFKGGVANYYGNLVKYWPAPNDIFVLDNNQDWLINRRSLALKWLPAIKRLRQAIKQHNIDHVIVGQILPLGLAALICKTFLKTKYSVILHGMDFSCATELWRKKLITKIILNQAEKIICANSYTAELMKPFLDCNMHSKIAVANPGVEAPATHNSQLITRLIKKHNLNNKILLLSVGRLIKRKGFDKVIEAIPSILKKVPNLVYAIIGAGVELENLKFQIENLKIKDNVLIINQTTNEERDAWYQTCDIFIMPSRNINGDFEGFGIVYLEANLAGKPVIAGRSGGAGDAVLESLNGLLVDGENIHEIAQAVIKLAFDPELRQRLGEQGRERAKQDFNWEKQIQKIHKIIQP